MTNEPPNEMKGGADRISIEDHFWQPQPHPLDSQRHSVRPRQSSSDAEHWHRPMSVPLLVPLMLLLQGLQIQCYHYHPTTSLRSALPRVMFRLAERKAPANNDFISRIFGAFLPTPEDIGLTRFNRTSKPENYYATTDEWAEKLPEDSDADVALVRPTLKYTNLEFRPLQLVYSATRDGWNARAFHERVDKRGPSVVLARTTSGGVMGGYNPTGWVNYGEYRGSIAAFLFTFPEGNTKVRAVKVPKISGAGRNLNHSFFKLFLMTMFIC